MKNDLYNLGKLKREIDILIWEGAYVEDNYGGG
jgi:hypothetical protein